MSANPLIDQGMAMFTAIAVLKLKRGQYRSTPDGVEIRQAGKPALLLTHHAAREFAQAIEEAEHD